MTEFIRVKCEDCEHNDYCTWPAYSCEFPVKNGKPVSWHHLVQGRTDQELLDHKKFMLGSLSS